MREKIFLFVVIIFLASAIFVSIRASAPIVTCDFTWPQKVVVNGTKYTCSSQRPYCNNEKAQLGIGQCCANYGPYVDCVSIGPTTCTENWSCGNWSGCTNGQQTRTCTDTNNCGTTTNKPKTSQSCTDSLYCKTVSPTQEAVVVKDASGTTEYQCNDVGHNICKVDSKFGKCCPTSTSANYDCILVSPKRIILQGQTTADKKTLTVGETWSITPHLTLTAQSIDAKASPRQVWLVLSKNGVKLDDVVVAQGQWYLYIEKSFQGQTDLNLFGVYIDSVFAGATSDMVQLRYAYINSVWWDELGSSSCTENWSCSSWSICTNGQQTKNCTDTNNCNTTVNKPIEKQSCACAENWSCNNWSACINSKQSKICTDLNKCGTILNKPTEEQSCVCNEDWSCNDWSTCTNGQQTKNCTDLNNCGTNVNKPLITQNCIVGQNCNEDWSCNDWSTCTNGQQNRTCTDKNNCNTTINKPMIIQNCSSQPILEPSTSTNSWSEQEKSFVNKIDKNLINRLKGYILLQAEEHGEAWYVDPKSEIKYYLKNGSTAYEALRKFGLGIKNDDLAKIPVGFEDRFQDTDSNKNGLADKLENGLGTDPNNPDSDNDGQSDGEEIKNNNNPLGPGEIKLNKKLADTLKGKILLQVESHGEAWYINPKDGKRYYMKGGDAAYQIMRFLSLGIKNNDLRKIDVGDL